MAFEGFGSATLDFLSDLAEHNDRDWFAANRDRYERVLLGPEKEFIDALGKELQVFDARVHAVPAVNGSIFRINRDIRFSRDKSPYKTHADLWFWIGEDRKTAMGYFLRMIPGEIWVGGGTHQMTDEQTARYRRAVVSSDAGGRLVEIVGALRSDGLDVDGEQSKRLPAGFSAEGARADLLRFKWVHTMDKFAPPPAEFAGPEFVGWCVGQFARTRPLVDWLAETVV